MGSAFDAGRYITFATFKKRFYLLLLYCWYSVDVFAYFFSCCCWFCPDTIEHLLLLLLLCCYCLLFCFSFANVDSCCYVFDVIFMCHFCLVVASDLVAAALHTVNHLTLLLLLYIFVGLIFFFLLLLTAVCVWRWQFWWVPMQLFKSAYNYVRFYNFNNFSDILKTGGTKVTFSLEYVRTCRCREHFLSLLQISGWKFPLGFSPFNFNLVCWKKYCSTDSRAEKVKISEKKSYVVFHTFETCARAVI